MTREQQLIEAIYHEEQSRLKQLSLLQHDIHAASTFISSLISQSKQLDDELLAMKRQDQVMKEMAQHIRQEFEVMEMMDLKNQPLTEINVVKEVKEKIKQMARTNRIVSMKMMKAMKVNEVENDECGRCV